MSTTFLFLAEGFEEIEALTVVDVLRRGGMEVQTVSISEQYQVTGAHGVTVKADRLWGNLQMQPEAQLVFPGGMPGAKNLAEHLGLMHLAQEHLDRGGRMAAICAAPALVLGALRVGRRCRVTCYPGFEGELPQMEVVPDGVVVDGPIITAKGPAFATAFALTLLREWVSAEVADEVAASMLCAIDTNTF